MILNFNVDALLLWRIANVAECSMRCYDHLVEAEYNCNFLGEAMDEQLLVEVKHSLNIASDFLLTSSGLKPGNLVVLGASTSEVVGSRIGSASSQEIGNAIISTLVEKFTPLGIMLAVGCCEHLNRAVVIPRESAERLGLTIVCVRPVLKAGGACGMAYYDILPDPVMVETIEAHAGMDIGDTLIGMHLRRVAVSIYCDIKSIGHANLVMARTRPKYIGGARAQYPD